MGARTSWYVFWVQRGGVYTLVPPSFGRGGITDKRSPCEKRNALLARMWAHVWHFVLRWHWQSPQLLEERSSRENRSRESTGRPGCFTLPSKDIKSCPGSSKAPGSLQNLRICLLSFHSTLFPNHFIEFTCVNICTLEGGGKTKPISQPAKTK